MTSTSIEKPRPSIVDSNELHVLKRKVKSSVEIYRASVNQFRQHADVALAEVLVAGSDLLRVRAIVGASHFESWVQQNFTGTDCLTLDEAKTFATLTAAQQHDDVLSSKHGIQKALQALEVFQ